MSPRFVRKTRSLLITIVTVCAILGVSAAVIAYGRGYRIDVGRSGLKPTGLVSATSDPIGAQVYVDGKLKTATNNSFNVDPNWYTVRISKEGYISWEKRLRVQGEVVSRADAFLFPTNPSLSPLTNLGIQNPTLSPDGSKIAYIVPNGHPDAGTQKAGLWVYELAEGPLGRNRDPIQVAALTSTFDMTGASLTWSPDSEQVLVSTTFGGNRLYEAADSGEFRDMRLALPALLAEWEDEKQIKLLQQLEAFKQPIVDIATTSAKIIGLSPDETKILYEATATATIPQVIDPALIGTNSTEETRDIKPGNIYVYDSKEDRNYLVLDKSEILKPTPTPTPRGRRPTPTPTPKNQLLVPSSQSTIHWFPTSRHLVLTLPGKIDIMEYDRTNWITVYSGPFESGFVAPWSNGSRIIILTNLNPDASTLPNLYTVNLR